MRLSFLPILMLCAEMATAQSSADVRARLKALATAPSRPMMLPMREGAPEQAQPPPGRTFSITDGVDTPVTFLIVPNQDSRATVANRYTLASGRSAAYDCGQPTCYVRFLARGGIQAVQVTRGRTYRFQFAGGRFDLYAVY